MSMGQKPAGLSEVARKMWDLADQLGWEHTKSKGGHHTLTHPVTGLTAMISNNLTFEGRASKNCEAQLRRGATPVEENEVIIRPKGWHEEYESLFLFISQFGWTAREQVNGSVVFTMPGASNQSLRKPDMRIKDQKWHHKTAMDFAQRILKATPLHIKERLLAEMDEFGVEAMSDLAISAATPVVTVAAVAPKPKREPEESGQVPSLTRVPWMASRGATLYESKAVVEVRDGDEVVWYECPTCSHREDNPRSAAAHYRRAHRVGLGRDNQNPSSAVNTDYRPSLRLLEALAEFLAAGDWVTPEDAALSALVWFHERPDLGDPEFRHFPAMTDTQIVQRIRTLVGTGVTEEEMEDLREKVEWWKRQQDITATQRDEATEEVARLVEANAALEREMVGTKAEVARLQGDIDAWMALAPRYGTGNAQG